MLFGCEQTRLWKAIPTSRFDGDLRIVLDIVLPMHLPILFVHQFRGGSVMVGPGRNDRRPGDKGLSTKSFAYRRDKS